MLKLILIHVQKANFYLRSRFCSESHIFMGQKALSDRPIFRDIEPKTYILAKWGKMLQIRQYFN